MFRNDILLDKKTPKAFFNRILNETKTKKTP